MELFVSNFAGKVKRITVNGREFLVAPLTLIVPGVLNGSRGPLYYPPEEISKNYSAWDGMPIVVNHPTTENGGNISARSPYVMKNFEIGRVYNTKINPETDSLQAEGWFDVQDTRRVDGRIYNWLRQGKAIELSTGLFTDNEPARNGATDPRTKKAYKFIAKNYRPDHLAILPDQKGACSLDDGCGVGIANMKMGNRKKTDPDSAKDAKESNDMTAQIAKITGDTALTSEAMDDGMHHHFVSDDPKTSAGKVSEWAKKMGHDPEASDEAGIYSIEFMVGKDEHMVHILPKEIQVKNKAGIANAKKKPRPTTDSTSNGDDDMKLNAKQRKGIISFLTTNCDCWKGDGDEEVLNEFDDDKLVTLKEHAEEEATSKTVVNTLKSGLKIGELVLTVNAAGKMVMKDGDEEAETTDEAKCNMMMKKKYAKNAEPEEEDEEEDEDTRAEKVADQVKNYLKNLSPKEKLALLPPEMVSAVNNAMKIEKQTKAKIVARLTANVSDPTKKASLVTKLSAKPLDELQEMLDIIPVGNANRHEEEDDDGGTYYGAGGGPSLNRSSGDYGVDEEEDVLPIYNGEGDDENTDEE